MARLDPLPPSEWPPEMKGALAALLPPDPRHPFPPRDDSRPKGLNVLGTFARHPALAQAFHTFNGHVLFATTLSPRQRELLVLRVAVLGTARTSGPSTSCSPLTPGSPPTRSPDQLRVPTRRGGARSTGPWSRAADELVNDAVVGDETWNALAAELDEQQLMDVVFTVGAYDLLAMALMSFGVETDGDLQASADPAAS